MDAHFLDFKKDGASDAQPSFCKVFDDFVLAINRDRASARELKHIDAMAASIESQLDSMMNEPQLLHAFRHADFTHQIRRALFEHTRADAFLTVFPAAILHDDRLDSA